MGLALQQIADERGLRWQDRQVDWKVKSPYGREHELKGFEGLVTLYEEYQSICDGIFRLLPVPAFQIDHVDDWRTVYRQISEVMEAPISEIVS